FVVNCNLQQLDGPVRGNGKVIQELEAQFRGAGWNVIKVVWGSRWDRLLAADTDGALREQMNTTPDGQFQTYSAESGQYFGEPFHAARKRLHQLVSDRRVDDLHHRTLRGYDQRKRYAVFHAARAHRGVPTVIVAETVKGWTLGTDFEAGNAPHQMTKMIQE